MCNITAAFYGVSHIVEKNFGLWSPAVSAAHVYEYLYRYKTKTVDEWIHPYEYSGTRMDRSRWDYDIYSYLADTPIHPIKY